MAKAIPADERKESPMEFLARNLGVAAKHLPQSDSKHLNHIAERGLPILIKGAYNWESFLRFVFSWQPVYNETKPTSGKHELVWSSGLNTDPRDEEVIRKEMEKVLFLTHYLNAMITNSKIAVAWSKLGEDNPDKTEWLHESVELKDALESLDKAEQWKEAMQIGVKMRELLRAMH